MIIRLLQREPGLRFCAEASDFGEALEAGRDCRPEVALIDVSLPGARRIELVKALRAEHPGLRMLVLSMPDESLFALRAIRSGAPGFVGKDAPYESPIDLIRSARRRVQREPVLTD